MASPHLSKRFLNLSKAKRATGTALDQGQLVCLLPVGLPAQVRLLDTPICWSAPTWAGFPPGPAVGADPGGTSQAYVSASAAQPEADEQPLIQLQRCRQPASFSAAASAVPENTMLRLSRSFGLSSGAPVDQPLPGHIAPPVGSRCPPPRCRPQQQHPSISRACVRSRNIVSCSHRAASAALWHTESGERPSVGPRAPPSACREQPAAAVAGVIRNGFAALLQHQLTGLEHRQLRISTGVEQCWKFIAGAWTHHQHLLGIA